MLKQPQMACFTYSTQLWLPRALFFLFISGSVEFTTLVQQEVNKQPMLPCIQPVFREIREAKHVHKQREKRSAVSISRTAATMKLGQQQSSCTKLNAHQGSIAPASFYKPYIVQAQEVE